jgi:hypothetical protein
MQHIKIKNFIIVIIIIIIVIVIGSNSLLKLDESGVFPVDIIPPWFPVGGRSSETYSLTIAMLIIIIIHVRNVSEAT